MQIDRKNGWQDSQAERQANTHVCTQTGRRRVDRQGDSQVDRH
jgi:hypothetical protein